MPNPFATGAVHVFVTVSGRSSRSPQYFGTTETFPQDTRQPEYEMVMNDASGSKVPLDMAWEGESAQISLVMTRWDETIAQQMEAKPNGFLRTPGTWEANDVGTLIGMEGMAWGLWLLYTFGASFADKDKYVRDGGMQRGRFYPQCIVWAPETETIGSRPMKRHFVFFAWPKIVQDPNRPNDPKKFVLYSTSEVDFQGVSEAFVY